MGVTGTTMHQDCRIHTSRLESGKWVASFVAPGGKVDHIRGEFASQDAAIRAAKEQIDQRARGISPNDPA
jgi:hypothetical protein